MTDEKLDLTDVTFIMPVRMESDHRENNVKTCLMYLTNHLDTNIILLENGPVSKYPNVVPKNVQEKVNYIYQKNNKYLFHKTVYLNTMAMKVKTPFMVLYDCDIILAKKAYEREVDRLRNGDDKGKVEYIAGYGNLGRVPQAQHKILRKTMDPHKLDPKGQMVGAVGSPVWMRTDRFKECGMENEKFLSWGFEDNERHLRFKRILRPWVRQGTPRSIWHLEHKRVSNNYNSNPKLNDNMRLYRATEKEELDQTIKRVIKFPWMAKYNVRQDAKVFLEKILKERKGKTLHDLGFD